MYGLARWVQTIMAINWHMLAISVHISDNDLRELSVHSVTRQFDHQNLTIEIRPSTFDHRNPVDEVRRGERRREKPEGNWTFRSTFRSTSVFGSTANLMVTLADLANSAINLDPSSLLESRSVCYPASVSTSQLRVESIELAEEAMCRNYILED